MSAPYSLVNNDEIESEWHIILVIVQYEIEGVLFFFGFPFDSSKVMIKKCY
jgi:hypothetical protein